MASSSASSSSSTVKILLAGDVRGNIDALYTRVRAVNAKAGPFDALFCVGQFFASGNAVAGGGGDGEKKPPPSPESLHGELAPFVTGAAVAPVPTYFVGAFGGEGDEGDDEGGNNNIADSDANDDNDATTKSNNINNDKRTAATLAALAARPDCGIRWLGRSGVTQIKGLLVAFLDGRFRHPAPSSTMMARRRGGGGGENDDDAKNADGGAEKTSSSSSFLLEPCRHFTRDDIRRLEASLTEAAGDVDLFLTCEWPSDVLAGLPDPSTRPKKGGCPDVRGGSRAIAALAADAIRPRYHVAGGGGGFYARPPYVNRDLGAGPSVTRFVALAPVGLVVGSSSAAAATKAATAATEATTTTTTTEATTGTTKATTTATTKTQKPPSLPSSSSPINPKWLHALALSPAATLPLSSLSEIPEGATPSPYHRDEATGFGGIGGSSGGGGGGGGGAGSGFASVGSRRPRDDGLGTEQWRWSLPKRGRGAGGGVASRGGGRGGIGGRGIGGAGRGGPASSNLPAPPPSLGRPGVVKDNRKTVFVRGLRPDASEQDIEDFFAPVLSETGGAVVDVRRRAAPGMRGALQRYAFVQFSDVASAERAIAGMSGKPMLGRSVGVEAAVVGGTRGLSHGAGGGGGAAGAGGGGRFGVRSAAGAGGGAGGAGGGMGAAAAASHAAPPPPQPVADCWFCLSNPNADVDLVVSVGDDAYVACDKGPLEPSTHSLVLPVEHAPSTLSLPEDAADEVEAFVAALRAMARAKGMAPLCWERHAALRARGGNHCQVNVVGLPAGAEESIERDLRAAAAVGGFELKEVPGDEEEEEEEEEEDGDGGGEGREGEAKEKEEQEDKEAAAAGTVENDADDDNKQKNPPNHKTPKPKTYSWAGPEARERLRDAVGDAEFFVALLPSGKRLFHAVVRGGARPPMTFARSVAAAAARVPERADWKECLESPPAEVERAERFKRDFAPFDPMGDGGGVEGGEGEGGEGGGGEGE